MSGFGTPLTYEAAQSRQFFRGRTEAIRSATKQTHDFATALDEGRAGDAELFALLSAASDRHRELTTASTNGQGIDRHLLALRTAALEYEVDLPHTLQSGGTLEGWDLSTSSLPEMRPSIFAPAKTDGYGVGYRPTRTGTDMTITSLRSGGHQSSDGSRHQNSSSLHMSQWCFEPKHRPGRPWRPHLPPSTTTSELGELAWFPHTRARTVA